MLSLPTKLCWKYLELSEQGPKCVHDMNFIHGLWCQCSLSEESKHLPRNRCPFFDFKTKTKSNSLMKQWTNWDHIEKNGLYPPPVHALSRSRWSRPRGPGDLLNYESCQRTGAMVQNIDVDGFSTQFIAKNCDVKQWPWPSPASCPGTKKWWNFCLNIWPYLVVVELVELFVINPCFFRLNWLLLFQFSNPQVQGASSGNWRLAFCKAWGAHNFLIRIEHVGTKSCAQHSTCGGLVFGF